MIISELENLKYEPLLFSHPCHNQDVKHHIKLVKESKRWLDMIILQRSLIQ